MHPFDEYVQLETRRQFFGKTAMGLGTAALASLMLESEGQTKGALSSPHSKPKAKRAIYLFMSGAPSQLDLWDYKPKMDEQFDKDLPDSIRKGQRLTTMTSGQKRFPVAPSMFKFKQHGECGTYVSELLPHTAKCVDDLALIRSVHTEAINHDPAITYIQTGDQIPGKPSLGAWLSYGLGSMNQNLPTFMVLNSTWSGRKDAQAIYNRLWGSGFLPSEHSGVLLRSTDDPVLYLRNPDGVSMKLRARMLKSLKRLNENHYEEVGDPETQARIAQYEMAFRMQKSVPDLVDLSDEPKHVLDAYGPDVHKPGTFAYHCLLARRMMERNVRLVQIFHRGWDQHGTLPRDLPNQCRDVDQPSAALLNDLKQRGLLDDTLVIWGGEFGRTIYCQGRLTRKNYGRDHHPRCYSVWMAGAGIKGGTVYGETDDFSYNIVKDPVHVRDLNATILNQLGIDHERFTVKHQGLNQSLTGVLPASPIEGILS